ncbi:MAG: PEP-CTERM sorting domain-containing protein, partial [Methyloversatilis discipulorum]|nr:PEP-CTERM sorting domain-containing protein [Methyloversatilis discipulorum]
MRLLALTATTVLLSAASLAQAAAPTAVATWNFNNTLAADEAGKPALTVIDPLATSGFMMDTVFGESRWVYRFDGNATPSQQAGLFVDSSGLLDADDAYSVDIVFQFEADTASWENIFGVSNRQSDNALYIDPGQR